MAALPAVTFAQNGARDGYFARYPFDKWKTEGPAAQTKWVPKALPATLSAHPRLISVQNPVESGKVTATIPAEIARL